MGKLTQTEKGHSPFEEEIRTLKMPACKAFVRKGKLVPVSFTPKGRLAATEAVAGMFPRSIGQHKGAILAAGKHLASPKPKRVAVLFSGGPAAGGNNVIVGLKRALGKSTLLGVRGGPKGLLIGDLFEITEKAVAQLPNTGGFDFLGTDRTKIKTDEQLRQVREVCIRHRLDAIVIIGGDDSNTNAALLAEHLAGVQVIGVPKTMDGDLQYGKFLPVPFGFDTATRIYAELVGNILQDMVSSRKYWHFVRLMGRSASHVVLEVALQTKPTIALVSEEMRQKSISLNQIVEHIAQAVVERSKRGMNYGLVLVPEGLLEFVPEVERLISATSGVMSSHPEISRMQAQERVRFIGARLSGENAALLASLPGYMQEMLVADRDSHGNLTVSQIETERLLVELVRRRVRQLSPQTPFATNTHFFGYEGRCGAPTLFDAMLAYNLGLCAGSLVLDGKSGYMASFTAFEKGGEPVALPLCGMLTHEEREGRRELVIAKALVRLESPAFKQFASRRAEWMRHDCISSPGPRQYLGKTAKQLPLTVMLNQRYAKTQFKV